MKKYIVDEHTGWKYELVGDYYLPIGTRFEDADPEEPASELNSLPKESSALISPRSTSRRTICWIS